MKAWKDYPVYTTKEDIIETANKVGYSGFTGGYVRTDGAWGMTDNPKEFKEMLEHFFGFEVIECSETLYSTAIAKTKCGLSIAWNGFCKFIG